MRGNRSNIPSVRFSKTLSWLLRHGVLKSNLAITADGYVRVDDVLALPQFSGCTVDMIRELVANDSKTRYSLREEAGTLMVCANQGHSIPIENLALHPLTSLVDCPQAIHGTFHQNLPSILQSGLKPMTRQHIHFSKREPNDVTASATEHDVSGIRRSCNVLIYLDVAKVLRDGIPLFESANEVILSPGNTAGCIPAEYFARVVDRKTGKSLIV